MKIPNCTQSRIFAIAPFIALSLVFTTSCSSTNEPKAILHHPDSAYVENYLDEVTNLLSLRHQIESASMSQFTNRFRNAREIQRIGKWDGNIGEVIGEIRDIDIDSNYNVYVLDGIYNRIAVYDSSGTFKNFIGQAGFGNEDFHDPQLIERFGKAVYMLDRNSHVKIINMSTDSWHVSKVLEMGYQVNDMCIIDGNIYTIGEYVPRVFEYTINVFSDNAVLLNSFGKHYASGGDTARRTLTLGGMISCNQATSTIVVAFRNLPMIYGYSTSGILKWATRVDDWNPAPIEELIHTNGLHSIRTRIPDAGNHLMSSLTDAGQSVIVQVAEIHPSESGNVPVYHSLLLSYEDGRGEYIGTDWGRIYAAKGLRLYSGVSRPLTQMRIFSLYN
jgi:hypothetical protein